MLVISHLSISYITLITLFETNGRGREREEMRRNDEGRGRYVSSLARKASALVKGKEVAASQRVVDLGFAYNRDRARPSTVPNGILIKDTQIPPANTSNPL